MRAVRRRCATIHPNLVAAEPDRSANGCRIARLAGCREPTLAELLLDGPLTGDDAARLTIGVALAVGALSAAGLVARELTPQRVHLHPAWGGVLADDALPLELVARPTVEFDEHLAYRSPEELDGDPLDERSSIYSLGALLFTALTGDPPFGGSWSSVYLAHGTAPRPRPSARGADIRADFDDVVARAMAIRPAERYAAASDLASALTKLIRDRVEADRDAAKRLAAADAVAQRVGAERREAERLAAELGERKRAEGHPVAAANAADAQRRLWDRARLRAERELRRVAKRARSAAAATEQAATDAAAQCVATPATPSASAEHDDGHGPSSTPRSQSASLNGNGAGNGTLPGPPRNAAPPNRNGAAAAKNRPRAPDGNVTASSAVAASPGQAPASLARARVRDQITAVPKPVGRVHAQPGRTPAKRGGRNSAAARSLAPRRSSVRPTAARARTPEPPTGGPASPSHALGTRRPKPHDAGTGAPHAPNTSPPPKRIAAGPVPLALGVGALACAAAIIATAGPDSSQPETSRHAAGPLSIVAPNGWRAAEPPASVLAVAPDRVTAASNGHGVTVVAAALDSAADVPRALGRWLAPGASPRTGRIGRLEAAAYTPLRPGPGLFGVAYVVHTTGESLLLACTMPSSRAVALRECRAVASTVRLRGEQPISVAAHQQRTSQSSGALIAFSQARIAGRKRLAAAQVAEEQAAAAEALVASHREATERIARSGMPSEAVKPLVAALTQGAHAYDRLARASSARNQRAFDAARQAVLASEHALRQANKRLPRG